jgi:ElaB/YqjD/DUF883 family membrane-anchored ribosome-binding protein
MNKNGMTDPTTAANALDDKIDSLRDGMKGFVEQGAQKVDAIKTKVVEVKDQAFTRGSDVLVRVTDMIKAHPLKAISIAFGAGYLGMRLFRR